MTSQSFKMGSLLKKVGTTDLTYQITCRLDATPMTTVSRGGARHFHLRGPLEGPVLQQGELSMVCVGLSERDLLQWHDVTRKMLGGPLGGHAKFLGGSGPPGTPLAPHLTVSKTDFSGGF